MSNSKTAMTITLTDLITSLRKASADPKNHAPAQEAYFSEANENSVLVHCGTACCIAGDLIMLNWERNNGTKQEFDLIISEKGIAPDSWAVDALGLSDIEMNIAFAPNTHYELHTLLADLLEAGLRVDSEVELILPSDSTYTDFTHAELDGGYVSLEELKTWLWESV